MDIQAWESSLRNNIVGTIFSTDGRGSQTDLVPPLKDIIPPPAALLNHFLGACSSKRVLNASQILMGSGVALIAGEVMTAGTLTMGMGIIAGASIVLAGLILGCVHFTASAILSEDPPAAYLLKTFKSVFEPKPLKNVGIYSGVLGAEMLLTGFIAGTAAPVVLAIGIPVIAVGFVLYFVAEKFSADAQNTPTANTPLLQHGSHSINS